LKKKLYIVNLAIYQVKDAIEIINKARTSIALSKNIAEINTPMHEVT